MTKKLLLRCLGSSRDNAAIITRSPGSTRAVQDLMARLDLVP